MRMRVGVWKRDTDEIQMENFFQNVSQIPNSRKFFPFLLQEFSSNQKLSIPGHDDVTNFFSTVGI